MLLKKQLHPDAPANGGTPIATPAKSSTTNIPLADSDFFDVANDVATTWQANPGITLSWKKSSEFRAEVTTYGASLSIRLDTGSLRPGQTFTLTQMDTQIDSAVKEVKVYIERKFKTAGATAQFARYGIIKENGNYRISRDRNNRKEALKLMKAAIAADGFAAEEFGTPFWTNMETDYTAALTLASSTTGDVSGKVSTKNEQKKAIKKVMTSLLNVLKGNFPDTYKAEYRKWGWKKESF